LGLVAERESDSENNDPTADQMYPNLLASLRVLASSASEQQTWAHTGGTLVPPPDEMRLSYLDHVPDLLYLYRDAQLIDDADEAALMKLERFLMRPTRDVMSYGKWSAVAESEEWDHARELAQAALASLSRPISAKRRDEVESD
jgi:hypothetical protein